MIVTFTDFGAEGPYLGQVKAVFHRIAPGVPVVDLVADAPAFDPRSSAYLLAALAPEFPAGTVFFCVVDPGVGGVRAAMVAGIAGRLFVGPDNGLFEPLSRRGGVVRAWEIVWRPERLSATFHGRDLFAPIAAHLAAGRAPETAGCEPVAFPTRPDWPDDLAAVIYVDRYGNAITGTRAAAMPPDAEIAIGGRTLRRARTFGDVAAGEAMWYENANGLVEFAVNGGRADQSLGVGPGSSFRLVG
ncbi:MAG: SAM-dependent chlorinase/fluorinase [Magnetospirillum sp.]|nr:SAM-dependent chlorinase/fluorinase [Magnetospirillum sp.]